MKIENVRLLTELEKILEIKEKDVLQIDRSLGAEHGVSSAIAELVFCALSQFDQVTRLKQSEVTTDEKASACEALLADIAGRLQKVLSDAITGFQGELKDFQQRNLPVDEPAFGRHEKTLLNTLQGGVETYQRIVNTTISTALRTSTMPPAMTPEAAMQVAVQAAE